MRLDKKAVKAICAGLELKDIEKVDASKKDIDEARVLVPPSASSFLPLGCSARAAHEQQELHTLGCGSLQVTALTSLPRLLRLDLGSNRLASLDALAAHSALKWLSVAHNGVTALPPLNIPELQISPTGQEAATCIGQ